MEIRFEFKLHAIDTLKHNFGYTLNDWVIDRFLYDIDEILRKIDIQDETPAFKKIIETEDISDDELLSCMTMDEDSIQFLGSDSNYLKYDVRLTIDKDKLLKMCEEK